MTRNDDFDFLAKRFEAYQSSMRITNEKLGLNPILMNPTGSFRYSQWFYKIALAPILMIVIYVFLKFSGILDSTWLFLKENLLYTETRMAIFAFISICLALGALAYYSIIPVIKTGFFQVKKNNFDVEKYFVSNKNSFFNEPLISHGSHKTMPDIFWIVIVVISLLLFALFKLILGITLLVLFLGGYFVWNKWYRGHKPTISFKPNGKIVLTYHDGKVHEFNVKDCSEIRMEYGSLLEENKPTYEDNIRMKFYELAGADPMYPNNIHFTASNGKSISVMISNLSNSNMPGFSYAEVEFYTAEYIRNNGFRIHVSSIDRGPVHSPLIQNWIAFN